MAHTDCQSFHFLATLGLASTDGFTAPLTKFSMDPRHRVCFDRGLTQIYDLNPICELLPVVGPCMVGHMLHLGNV